MWTLMWRSNRDQVFVQISGRLVQIFTRTLHAREIAGMVLTINRERVV